jgi:hypothetical protein
MVKFPHGLFADFSIEGGLHQIFRIAFQYKSPTQWKQTTLSDPSVKESIVEMFGVIEQSLIEVLSRMLLV